MKGLSMSKKSHKRKRRQVREQQAQGRAQLIYHVLRLRRWKDRSGRKHGAAPPDWRYRLHVSNRTFPVVDPFGNSPEGESAWEVINPEEALERHGWTVDSDNPQSVNQYLDYLISRAKIRELNRGVIWDRWHRAYERKVSNRNTRRR